ncbi:MAG: hypothetical protein F6K62_24510 [Sphaerospermopsis sp. SIO1G2]|nr:hypothetical protein [Sphaerospermopsis sp. SIO1G2]
MNLLSVIHEGVSNTSWMFFLAVGIWGTVRAVRGQSIDGSYLGALAIGELIFVAQAVVGGIMWLNIGSGVLVRPGIHLLYGVFALLFLPFVYYAVLRGDDSNRGQWVMAFCCLFMFGIAIRAITTAVGYAG